MYLSTPPVLFKSIVDSRQTFYVSDKPGIVSDKPFLVCEWKSGALMQGLRSHVPSAEGLRRTRRRQQVYQRDETRFILSL